MAGIHKRLVLIRHELIVRAVAAGGQDDRLGVDGVRLAVALGLHADDSALVDDQLGRRGGKHQGAAHLLKLRGQVLHDARAAAFAGVGAAAGALVRHSRAVLGHQPVKCGADGVSEQLDGRHMILLVTVLEHRRNKVLGRLGAAILLGPGGAGGLGARASHRAGAAGHAGLLQQDDALALLNRLDARSQAGSAAAHDHDVGFQRLLDQLGSGRRGGHLLHIGAGLLKGVGHRRLERVRGHRRASDRIHAERLALQHGLHQLRQGRSANALGLGMLDHLNRGDLLRIDGHRQLHVAVEALSGRLVRAGSHGHRAHSAEHHEHRQTKRSQLLHVFLPPFNFRSY